MLTNAHSKQAFAAPCDEQAKGLEQPTNGVSRCLALRYQTGSGHEQHAQGMSIHAFHGDLPVPPGANHLCQAERVIRVGFVDLKTERRLGVAGVHADDGHAVST